LKPLFLLPCLILFFTVGLAQDSVWKETKIDENLSIDMPGEVVIVDTLGQRAYRSIDGNAIYVVTKYKGVNISVDNPESLDEFLDGMAEGFSKKMQKSGLKITKPKSIHIDSIEGRYLRCYTDNPNILIREWIAHMFFVNGIAYTLVVAYTDDRTTKDQKGFTQFVQSINFNSTFIAENTFANKGLSRSYKIGELIGSTIIPLGIVGLILYFVLRKKKPKPRF